MRGLGCLVLCIASISWGSWAGVVEGQWTATPSAVARGETLRLEIALDNTSASAISSVTLFVPLPLGADQWTAEVRTDGGTWHPYPANGLIVLDPLPALERRDVDIKFRVEVGSPARLAFVAQLLNPSGVLLELAGTVNVLPSVDAGPDVIVDLGTSCDLAVASVSDGGGLVRQVEWTDNGAGGGFDDAHALNPTYTPPAISDVVELTLTAVDADAGTSSDSLRVRVNAPPWVDAGSDLDAAEGGTVDLRLIDLADPDGWIEEIRWSDGGAGGAFVPSPTMESPTYAIPLIDGCADDQITLTVTVVDEWGATFSDALTVNVQNVNAPPQVSVSADTPVISGGEGTVRALATDEDGTIVSQSWEQVGGPDAALHREGPGTEVRFVAPEIATERTLQFRFTAVDNCGACTMQNVEVLVIPQADQDGAEDEDAADDEDGTGGDGDDRDMSSGLRVDIDLLDARGVPVSPPVPPACGQAATVRVSVLNTGESMIHGLTGVLDSGETLDLMSRTLDAWSTTSGICEWIVPLRLDDAPLRLAAVVRGVDEQGTEVVASCTYVFQDEGGEAAPAMTLSLAASVASAAVGDAVSFVYSVANSGDASLSGLTLDDDSFGRIDLPRSELAPGDHIESTLSYTVRSSDLAGSLSHGALARAFTDEGACVLAEARVNVALVTPAGGGASSTQARLVFSEIAWAGTAVDATAEWIELANLGPDSVDLAGWTIAWYEKTGGVPARETWHTIDLIGVIGGSAAATGQEETGPRFRPAGDGVWAMSDPRWTSERADGYFLLERGSDNTVSTVRADQVYGDPGDTYYELPDAGAAVFLLNAEGAMIDSANAQVASAAGWAAGRVETGATMERVDLLLGDYEANWQTSPGILTYGLDATGSPITGTAGQPNARPLDELIRHVEAELHPMSSAESFSRTLPYDAASRPSICTTVSGSSSTGGGGAVSAPVVSTSRTDGALHLAVDLRPADAGDYCIWIGLENGRGIVLPLHKPAE